VLAGFRGELYECLTRRGDALFETADAVLCADGPVRDLARLSLVPVFRRGHGAVYDGLNAGRVDVARLRRALAGLPLPAWGDGRIRLAADVSNWLRPAAETSPGRLLCHVRGRGKNAGQVIAGWPYSLVCALGPGASSWAPLLDAVRLGPADDVTEVTAAQLRQVVERLIEAGHWQPGDQDIIIAVDAGYPVVRLAWLLDGLPVQVVGRVRANQRFFGPPPPARPGRPGKPPKHGARLRCADPASGPAPDSIQDGTRTGHGPVRVTAWNRQHQMINSSTSAWEDWPGKDYPVIEGTLIRITCAGLEPMWLWASAPDPGEDGTRALWQAYLRRFDIEHVFRFLKQQLGWTSARLRDPAAADRWTWIVIACYAQLWLARGLAGLTRLPWQPPRAGPAGLTPGQARAAYSRLRQKLPCPARPPKPARPGPGRPPGSKNTTPAPRHRPGKTRLKQASKRNKQRKQAKRARKTTRARRLNGKSAGAISPLSRRRPASGPTYADITVSSRSLGALRAADAADRGARPAVAMRRYIRL
jgi:hypothetical protein